MLRISLESGIEDLERRIEHTHQVIGLVFLDLGRHVFVMSFMTCLEHENQEFFFQLHTRDKRKPEVPFLSVCVCVCVYVCMFFLWMNETSSLYVFLVHKKLEAWILHGCFSN